VSLSAAGAARSSSLSSICAAPRASQRARQRHSLRAATLRGASTPGRFSSRLVPSPRRPRRTSSERESCALRLHHSPPSDERRGCLHQNGSANGGRVRPPFASETLHAPSSRASIGQRPASRPGRPPMDLVSSRRPVSARSRPRKDAGSPQKPRKPLNGSSKFGKITARMS